MAVELEINGVKHRLDVDPGRSLLDILRNELDLTGTKYGCGEGQCAACTVLLDGRAVQACLTPVGGAAWKKVTTIEGLARDGRLHPVQQAFLDQQALQCGYCTPGMIMTAVALVESSPTLDANRIRAAMNGNLCRCGTYPRIVEAVRQASQAGQTSQADQADQAGRRRRA